MCPARGLLGPPGITHTPDLAADATATDITVSSFKPVVVAGTSAAQPFLDVMDAGVNSFNRVLLRKGLTENFSPTFLSSGNPCLDFFFQVVPDTPAAVLTALLDAAWRQDPLTALKLVCHLRGVRGTGKSDKESFYSAALWLHQHHPKTLALNIGSFAEFGYMKDLLEILYRLIDGPDTRKIAKLARPNCKATGKRRWRHAPPPKKATLEDYIAAKLATVKIDIKKTAGQKQQKVALAVRAVACYGGDGGYRFLHDRIADLFASLLSSDLEQLTSGNLKKIGLAAKWCPSLDSSFDRATLLCESIARRMFPRDSDPEYADIEEQHYAYRIRDRLRRVVLVPLRKILELPEVYMSSGRWDSLPYNRVASVAMKTYKTLFFKHDEVRFAGFLEKVKEGKAKIAAGALLPHEIVAAVYKHSYWDSNTEDSEDEVAELQWRRMVDDLMEKGKLRNCIAICDVSGSMTGTPMDVSIALGLLMSELSEEPWKGRLITFSKKPQLHRISGKTLKEKAKFVAAMEWGMNTDFQAVFDRILEVAVEGRLTEEQMVKRVFVFSDMEFDQASAYSWETDYEAIHRKFTERGYGSCVPEIVFWNLRNSRSTPVPSTQKGVALVSGFSKNLMKMFLEGKDALSPVAVMEAAIADEEYQKLVVFD